MTRRYRRLRSTASRATAGRMPEALGIGAAQAREAQPGATEEDGLLAVAREARLHEELDVAAAVGTGDVEARRAPSGAVAQEVLDEPEADVAGLAVIDGVELDDGPLVAVRVALDAGQAGQSAVLLVDVQLVVGLEGAQRHAEEAEHRDVAGRDGQAQRAGRSLRTFLAVARGSTGRGVTVRAGWMGQP